MNIRETSAEKFKSLLSPKIKSGLIAVPTRESHASELSTNTERKGLLKHAEDHRDTSTNARDLPFESR
jgi:hypothetical protein